MSKLFIVEGNQTKVLDQKAFDNETLLQDLVERFPEVIAQDDLGVTEPFIVIGREVATKAGYIDVLCIDGDGVLSVIETKLARNSQPFIPNEELHAFRESLDKLPEVELPTYMVDEGKYPNIPVKSVIQPEDFERFTNEVLRLQTLVK